MKTRNMKSYIRKNSRAQKLCDIAREITSVSAKSTENEGKKTQDCHIHGVDVSPVISQLDDTELIQLEDLGLAQSDLLSSSFLDLDTFINSGFIPVIQVMQRYFSTSVHNQGRERSTLPIVLMNDKKHVIGFMSLCDHPNVTSIEPGDWEKWMRNMYEKFYLSRNTLFIHLMACLDNIAATFMEDALLCVFKNDAYLKNIIMMVPPSCPVDILLRFLKSNKYKMQRHFPKCNTEGPNALYFYWAKRVDYIPRLKVRSAVEEDNDDIIEILDKNCHDLKELYDAYYISEILGRHPEMQRTIIVGEHRDQVVAVMCINTDINYKMLQRTYELKPYCGLMKSSITGRRKWSKENNLLKTFGDPIMLGQFGPFDHVKKFETLFKDDVQRRPRMSKKSISSNTGSRKGGFRRRELLRKDTETFVSIDRQSFASNVVGPQLDDDPFDYDIVNIDYSLFAMPHVSIDNASFQIDKLQRPAEKTTRAHNVRKEKTSAEKKRSQDITSEFVGEPNAFMIELYGVQEDFDDRQCFEMLQMAFRKVSNADFCIIRVPTQDSGFSLLQHFSFVPIKDKANSEYALYVAHRNSVLGKLRVRLAEIPDIPQIAKLLYNLDGKETMWTIENSLRRRRSRHTVFVFQCGVSLIGFAITEPLDIMNNIISTYKTEPFHNHKYHYQGHGLGSGFSVLKTFIAYPVYEPHFRYFARDIIRLSGNHGLFWLTGYRSKMVMQRTNTMISSMVPLLPRKTEIISDIPELRKLSAAKKMTTLFSTWFLNRKLTCSSKINVDTRIVVTGTSRMIIGFLHSLIFSNECTYLTFTSVTVISPFGIPFTRAARRINELMFRRHSTQTDRYLRSVPIIYYVNCVHGTTAEINKTDKYVALTSGKRFYYDKLFLFHQEEYQHPDYMKVLREAVYTQRSLNVPKYTRLDTPVYQDPVKELRILDLVTPHNVYFVNNHQIANRAFNFLDQLHFNPGSETSDSVIVYGTAIHAYCCMEALLEAKVPAKCIYFVEPFPSLDPNLMRVSGFCNEYVDHSVMKTLEALNINVFRSFYFASWTVNEENYVTSVDFLSDFRMVTLNCSALFYYGERGIDAHAFVAINKAGIAYDGGILIDHNFRTKDSSIYAAGAPTRYYRAYRAELYHQEYYNCFEIGERLGNVIRNELDPLFNETGQKEEKRTVTFSNKIRKIGPYDDDILPNVEESGPLKDHSESHSILHPEDSLPLLALLPKFSRPITTYCILPGGLQYLEVRPPGKKIPNFFLQSLDYNGHVIETFKRGYFKLHFNNNFVVDGVTCLIAQTEYSLDNFRMLYGLSSALLNNVFIRYAAKKIDDLYSYFRQPWAYFLYHEGKTDMLRLTKELLPKGINDSTITESMKSIRRRRGENLSAADIRHDFEMTAHYTAITEFVLNWVTENEVLLPMYLKPENKAHYIQPARPLVKKKKRSISHMISSQFE